MQKYSQEQAQEFVKQVDARPAGTSAEQACKELGITRSNYNYWKYARLKPKKRKRQSSNHAVVPKLTGREELQTIPIHAEHVPSTQHHGHSSSMGMGETLTIITGPASDVRAALEALALIKGRTY